MVRILLAVLDRVFKLLISTADHRVCYLSSPDYGDSAYYMYRHLAQTRPELEHVWLLNDDRIAPRITAEFRALVGATGAGGTLRVARKNSLRGYFLYLTCRHVFYTHGLYGFSNWPWRRQIVCLWHGMPIKRIGALNRPVQRANWPFGTLYLATSHFFKYVVSRAFEVLPESVRVLGLPRCDALRFEDARAHREADIRSRLKMRETERLVVWLPTFREHLRVQANAQARSFCDDVPPEILECVAREAAQHQCRIIVKLHPKDRLNLASLPAMPPGLEVLRSDDWLCHEIQLYDLLAASAALISDVSSVVVDYLVTRRPIGILGHDPATYDRGLTFPLETLFRSKRVHPLANENSIREFFRASGAGDAYPDDPGELTAVWHEPVPGKSAELLAREVGL